MRVIAKSVLIRFAEQHPETRPSLDRWHALFKAAEWGTADEVQRAAPKAKVLNGERVRFEVAGGNYRMVVAFDFRRRIAFIKFIGSHAEYDKVDALEVSQF
ncbi:type II toxin-antitoxin system HigB family toxin [Roseiarcus fermentans]|nr:type II toxin-antitoxin system HigB family toxin [Roseiarcus fermentans]